MTSVLVIDDEAVVRNLMVEILHRSGYAPIGAGSAREALSLLDAPELELVVSDILMPGLSGFELLAEVRARRPSLPVLLVTGSATEANLQEALARGAAGLLVKPFTQADLKRTVADVLERVRSGERELRERLVGPALTSALTGAMTVRDDGTGVHVRRLELLAVRLGEEVGLAPADLEAVRLGANLHDIGKIGIPDRVLLKPGPLDTEEATLMRSHTVIGDHLLASLEELRAAREVVRHHHERWDGSGYPDGLAGEAIPVAARIVAVADAIEAMSARRPYREPLTADEILAELARGRGTQWDPRVVDAVRRLIDRREIEIGADGLIVHERASR